MMILVRKSFAFMILIIATEVAIGTYMKYVDLDVVKITFRPTYSGYCQSQMEFGVA